MDNPGHYDEYPELTRADAERERASSTITSPKAVNSGQTEREALLPCPFCGDKAEYKHNSLHGDESMAVCRCCGAQAFWSKWQARALLADQSPAPASPSGEDAAEEAAASMGGPVAEVWPVTGAGTLDLQGALGVIIPRASEQADEAVTADVFDWLETEVTAISCRYHGDPSYDHDAYWMRDRVVKLIGEARNVFAARAKDSK